MEEQSLNKALGPGPDCPSIERLGRYADGLLAPDERRREEAHIVACANCQAELTLLHAFESATIREDEAEAVQWGADQLQRRTSEIFDGRRIPGTLVRRWPSFRRLSPVLAVAIVLLAIGGGYYLTNPAAPALPVEIGSSPESTRALSIALTAPIGDQTTVPGRLQWQPVSGATRYRVRLSEVDRQEVWSSDTADTEVDLPTAVRARIVPGKTLVWQVTAIGASNAPIAESRAERFRLAP